MTKSDVSKLLTYIAELDGRQITPATVEAWHDVLGDLGLSDCRQAVIEHNRTSTDYLKPGHVRLGVKRLRRRRLEDLGLSSGPIQVNAADEDGPDMGRDARRRILDAAGSGTLNRQDYQEYLKSPMQFGEFEQSWLGISA